MSLLGLGYFSNQFFCGNKGTLFANRILDNFLVDKILKNNKLVKFYTLNMYNDRYKTSGLCVLWKCIYCYIVISSPQLFVM